MEAFLGGLVVWPLSRFALEPLLDRQEVTGPGLWFLVIRGRNE